MGTTIRMSEKVTRNCTRYLLKITQPMIHVNSVYKYKYKYVVLINFLIWADSASSKNQRSLNKSPNTRHEKPPLSCWLELPKRCSRHSSHYCCPWLSPQRLKVTALLKTTCTSETGLRDPSAGRDLNASPNTKHYLSWC